MGGLNVQTMDNITDIIVKTGFNCVRLPYSLDLYYNKNVMPEPLNALKANPELIDAIAMKPILGFHLAVQSLTGRGLTTSGRVNHCSKIFKKWTKKHKKLTCF